MPQTRKVLSHRSGGWKYKTKLSQGCGPSGAAEGGPSLPYPSFWGPRMSLGVAASLQALPPSSHSLVLSLCVRVQMSFS